MLWFLFGLLKKAPRGTGQGFTALRDMRGLQAGRPRTLDQEQVELTQQGQTSPSGLALDLGARRTYQQNPRQCASSLDIVPSSWGNGGRHGGGAASGGAPTATGIGTGAAGHGSSSVLENGELRRLQEKRARAQKELEREREQERHDRDKNQENLIPDSKKAPQLLAAISVSTGCVSYGICMAYTSSAIPSMLAPNNSLSIEIGSYETTWMSSLLALGALFGSLSAVYLMDAVGRKASLLAFSVMSLFIGWTLLMAASQTWQLYAGRFLLGLGAGLEITISPVYIHEICRPVMRDVCGSFPQIFIAVGILICYIMGRSLEWNWLALASCVFLFPFTFGLYFIPESPPWLVYNDEEDLAFKSMVLIRGEEYDATVEIRKIKDNLARHQNDLHALLQDTETERPLPPNTATAQAQQQRRSTERTPVVTHNFRFSDLWQTSVLYPFIVILVLMFLLQFSGQGAITFYTALIFKEAECIVDANDCALIIGVTYFLSSIVGLILKKHIGRRILLLVSELGMAVSQLAMGTYFYLLRAEASSAAMPATWEASPLVNMEQVRWLPIPILVLFTAAFNIGMGSLTWVVATEILPIRSKRWTHTISNVTSNFWWFVVTKTFKDMHRNVGPYVPFFLYGSVCVFGFFFIFFFLPETHGRTAEETAEWFSKLSPSLFHHPCKKRRSSHENGTEAGAAECSFSSVKNGNRSRRRSSLDAVKNGSNGAGMVPSPSPSFLLRGTSDEQEEKVPMAVSLTFSEDNTTTNGNSRAGKRQGAQDSNKKTATRVTINGPQTLTVATTSQTARSAQFHNSVTIET